MPAGIIPVIVFLAGQTGALIWWASRVNTLIATYETRISELEKSDATVDKRIQESRHSMRGEMTDLAVAMEDRVTRRIDGVERRRSPR